MRTALALALGLCLIGLLAACGGGGDSTSTGPEAQTTASAPEPSQPDRAVAKATAPATKSSQSGAGNSAKHGSRQPNSDARAKSAAQTNSADNPRPAAGRPAAPTAGRPKSVRVPPISSAPRTGSKKPAPGVKTVKGGDNSVQEYGVEASESGRREAAVALQAYLDDRLEGNWTAACAALGQKAKQQLEEAAESATEQGAEVSGCPDTMALYKEGPAQLAEQAKITEVLSFRSGGDVAGNPSYLIFSGPPSSTLYSMPMYQEEGGWKVGLLRAAELPV